MSLRHPAIAFDNQIAQTYRISPKSKHTSQTLQGPEVFFSEQSLGIFYKSGEKYSWQREYIEGYDAAADDDDVHLQCSCCCHRRSSLNGQVGCRASRSRDNWSCQHNLRITSSPWFPQTQYRLELIIFFHINQLLDYEQTGPWAHCRFWQNLQVSTPATHSESQPGHAVSFLQGDFFRNCRCSWNTRSQLSSQRSILCQLPTPTIITYNPQRRRLPHRFSPLRSRNPQNNHRFAQPTVFFLMLDNNDNVVFGQFYLILQCNIFGSFLSSSYVVEKLSLNVLIWKLKDSKGEPEEVHWQDRCQIPNDLNISVGRLGSLRQCRSLRCHNNERKCRKGGKCCLSSTQKFNCAPFLQSYPSHHAQLS